MKTPFSKRDSFTGINCHILADVDLSILVIFLKIRRMPPNQGRLFMSLKKKDDIKFPS
nr:MAG TPA: hypothetical protein [Caudoviricetes sp.]